MNRPSKRVAKAARRDELGETIAAASSSVAKVSHTLEIELAERLREFAFRERISESAVIEFALQRFFFSGKDPALAATLRLNGAGKRRKT